MSTKIITPGEDFSWGPYETKQLAPAGLGAKRITPSDGEEPWRKLLRGEPRPYNPRQYALQPLSFHKYSGWFPLGRNTVVSASSGGMKTTMLSQSLVAGRDGQEFLGHKPGYLPFIFLFADRGKDDVDETFERMGIEGKVPFECINGISRNRAVARIAEVAESGDYKILVVDGADLLVPDNNKGESVGDFTLAIQNIAQHYGAGTICTTGSSKTSGKDLKDGAERRSLTKGSEVWGRTGGSVFTLNSEGHDGTQETRRLKVQHRNARTESYLLQLQADGLLHAIDEPEKQKEESQLEKAKKWYEELFTDSEGISRDKVSLTEHNRALIGKGFEERPMREARKILGIEWRPSEKAYRRI
jgi:hypothetical protein